MRESQTYLMLEELFGKTQSILLMIIIVLIAAAVAVSALSAAGVFESRRVPYATSISNLEVQCSGGLLQASMSISVSAQQTLDVMPVLIYRGSIGYSESNKIHLEKGVGQGRISFTISPDSILPGKPVLTLTLWKWSPGGCLNRTITEDSSATYAKLVSACAADFIKSEAIESDSECA